MHAYSHLALAIGCEVIATSLLKASNGFSRPWHGIASIAGYVVAFHFLGNTLRTIPTGVAYAIWSGVGIVLISVVGWIVFKQRLDLAAIVGMALIALGVIVINVFSKSVEH